MAEQGVPEPPGGFARAGSVGVPAARLAGRAGDAGGSAEEEPQRALARGGARGGSRALGALVGFKPQGGARAQRAR